jgi:hypothetical protein
MALAAPLTPQGHTCKHRNDGPEAQHVLQQPRLDTLRTVVIVRNQTLLQPLQGLNTFTSLGRGGGRG